MATACEGRRGPVGRTPEGAAPWRLRVLGSGTILATASRQPPGYALEDPCSGRVALLDPGPGTWARLPAAGLDPRRIDRVLVSHLHVDHHADLLALLFARANPEWRAAGLPALSVLGPPGLSRVLAAWVGLYGDAVDDPGLLAGRLGPGPHDLGGLRVRSIPALHGAEALSLELVPPGRGRLVYTGDTGPNPALAEFAARADMLLCECSFPDAAPRPGHLTPALAGRLAREAGVGRLVLTHFYPGTAGPDILAGVRREWDGRVDLAGDLECFEL